ncbi:MAG TPA: hypothetical protein VFK16_08005 [Gemmatimonadaceae bacterium]|nr:hypothetical protein [Gemmatimonadaceae bacterium]
MDLKHAIAGYALSLLLAAPAGAQTAAAAAIPDSVGVMLVAHGGGAAWNSRVDSLAVQVRSAGVVRGPLGVSFLMGPAAAEHRFQDVADSLAARGARVVVVVPLLVSSYSGHYEQIRYLTGLTDSLSDVMRMHLHMSGIQRPARSIAFRVTPALDSASELVDVLVDRALAVVPHPAGRALFFMAHGPNSAEAYAAWMAHLRPVVQQVKARAGFATASLELIRDDAPATVKAEARARSREIIALQHQVTGQDVAVVPILMSSSGINRTELPDDLAGLPVLYDPAPLLPHPAMVRWVERMTRSAVSGPAVAAASQRH